MLAIPRHFHLIGIGGIGVSGIAKLLLATGHTVSGSDVRASRLTRDIEALGGRVFIGHDSANLAGAQTVVVSTAIVGDNPEWKAAHELGLPVVHRSEILGGLLATKESIGVTGTHGKGTVSSMITACLDHAGWNPAFVIGAILHDYDTNARWTAGHHLIAEVDESDGSLVNTKPETVVINNLELDHLNYYKNFSEVLDRFEQFFVQNTKLRRAIVSGDDPGVLALLPRLQFRPVTVGRSPQSNYRFEVQEIDAERSRFVLFHGPDRVLTIALNLPGEYNVENAAVATATALELGVPSPAVAQALANFRGLENRFTVQTFGPITTVKDYLTHPGGMRKVLVAARKLTRGRLIAVFKPYRFTMVQYLHNDYAQCFKACDRVVLTALWDAGEIPIPGIDDAFLAGSIRSQGTAVDFVAELKDLPAHLLKLMEPGDTYVFFGGPDLFEICGQTQARIGEHFP